MRGDCPKKTKTKKKSLWYILISETIYQFNRYKILEKIQNLTPKQYNAPICRNIDIMVRNYKTTLTLLNR